MDVLDAASVLCLSVWICQACCVRVDHFCLALVGVWSYLGVVQTGGICPKIFRLHLQFPGAGKEIYRTSCSVAHVLMSCTCTM